MSSSAPEAVTLLVVQPAGFSETSAREQLVSSLLLQKRKLRVSQKEAEMGFMKRMTLLDLGYLGLPAKVNEGRKCRDISVHMWIFLDVCCI